MSRRAAPWLAAYAADVQVGTLSAWVKRGHISAPVDGEYDLDEILEWLDRRSPQHAAAARTRRDGVVSRASNETCA